MKDAQKPDHVSLNTLIGRLREGRFVIPDFQREFEWKPWDIRDLMRSIFLDYYIGSLLLWSGKKENFDALSCEALYGFKGNGHREYIVLDGQQRLTALYYAFFAPDEPLPGRANRYFYFVRADRFMAEEYDTAFEYQWSRNWEQFISDKEKQFEEHIFPLSVVGEGGWALANWAQAYEKYWRDRATIAQDQDQYEEFPRAQLHADNASAFGEHLRTLTDLYQISYIELDKQLEIDKICDIFTQINSKGVRLDTFDLMNALLKPKGLKLKQMWRDARPRLEFVDTEKMNTYILQVMSLLRQGYSSPKYLYFLMPGQVKPIRNPDGTRGRETLIPNVAEFKERWNVAVNALEVAVNLLRHPQEFGAISSNYLPYVSILPAFAALQAQVRALPGNQQLSAQRKVRHWYWASVFLNRYSGAVESTTARDFSDVKVWMDDDNAEPALIQELKTRFPGIDLRKELKKGTSVYNGIFNLLVIQGARDWMTGNVPQYGELDDHHIIPKSKAIELKTGDLIHSILNRTPLTAETNRQVIADRWPSEYLPELIKQNSEKTVRAIFETHFISSFALKILMRSPFSLQDYEEFITERNRTFLEAIEDMLIKRRIDLTPQLRELDQRIERIEINLRGQIDTNLNSDMSRMPQHVNQKVEERIQAAAKRNAALNSEEFKKLLRRLEYCDLRELQDTVLNKSLWPLFETRFLNKEALVAKFGQLAELRNGIRHSRTVDEITRKEGEAAVLWFEQLLAR